MARLVLALLAVLPVFTLAMDQWGFLFCPSFSHDGSFPNNQILYLAEFALFQPLRLYAAAEPDNGKNISCVKMIASVINGVSVTYNLTGVQQPTVNSTFYVPINILMNYYFSNVSNYLFGASPGGSTTLVYTSMYNNQYAVFKNCFQGFLMHWVRTYVFVPNYFNATAANFTTFQTGFRAKYGVTLSQKIIC